MASEGGRSIQKPVFTRHVPDKQGLWTEHKAMHVYDLPTLILASYSHPALITCIKKKGKVVGGINSITIYFHKILIIGNSTVQEWKCSV